MGRKSDIFERTKNVVSLIEPTKSLKRKMLSDPKMGKKKVWCMLNRKR